MGFPQVPKPADHPTTRGATFDRLKSPVGEWEGSFNEGGQQIPATTSFRLVSDGSALMNVLGAGRLGGCSCRSLPKYGNRNG